MGNVLNECANPFTGYTKLAIIVQKATIINNNLTFALAKHVLEIIVPVAAALLESQEVSKGCCIGLDTEAP